MEVRLVDLEDVFNSCSYNVEDKHYYITSTNRIIKYKIKTMLHLDPQNDDISNFNLYILKNSRSDCGENSIYTVSAEKNNNRIGWIFPIQALFSNEHSYSDNRHFLNYAYFALPLYIQTLNGIYQLNDEEELDLSYQVDNNISVLIIDKRNCSKISNFEINNYIISLFNYGYSYTGDGNVFKSSIQINKKIVLKKISNELKNKEYYNKLFKEYIPCVKNPYFRFYVYYQIIELLIDEIFDSNFGKLIEDIRINEISTNESKELLNTILNEKDRVKQLLHKNTKVDAQNLHELQSRCNSLLSLFPRESEQSDYATALYKVRCLMVHQMYKVINCNEDIISDIDDVFLDVIIDALLTFKIDLQT